MTAGPSAADRPDLIVDGVGVPIVLVHGSFSDASVFDAIAPLLRARHRVVTYDRRGHGARGRFEPHVAPQGLDVEADDLCALLEHLALGPAVVVGMSTGGSIALLTLARRPDLVRAVVAHEPPAFDLLTGVDAVAEEMAALRHALRETLALLHDGHVEEGTRRFVDGVVRSPGGFDALARAERTRMLANADAWCRGAGGSSGPVPLPTDALAGAARPVLVTRGEHCPALYVEIVDRLAALLVDGRVRVVGTDHFPLANRAGDYAEIVAGIVAETDDESA